MRIEHIILITVWIVTIVFLLLFIPKNKVKIAHVAFLFMQVITWLVGLLVVELKLIEYPVGFFKNATQTSMTFEYLVYPAISSFFMVYYPETKSTLTKVSYYFLYVSLLTIFEIILARYTHLIKYLHWHWYWTWLTLLITLGLSRLYMLWFFREENSPR